MCGDKIINLDSCTDFQKKVLKAVSLIPYGETRTYSDIAKKIGNPKASRAVGSVLANNPFPIIIPCHRVIRSDGDIGNYQGGRKMKEFLLDLEKIQI